MNHSPHHAHAVTAEADRLPLATKVGYGFGGMSYNIMANGIGNLAPFIFNILLGVNPALVGLAIALPRLYDAVTDPVMGAISDNFRSRWGRRKPFMVVGGIGAGFMFALIWMMPGGWSSNAYFWWLLGTSILFYTFVTIFCVPWTALGFSLTPDYHERTRLMAVSNFLMSATVLGIPWLFALTKLPVFEDGLQGVRVVGLGTGFLVTVLALLSVLLAKERTASAVVGNVAAALPLRSQFREVLVNPAFLILCGAVLMMCLGIFSISSITPYIAIYYIKGGDEAAASVLMGAGGTLWGVASLALVFPVSIAAQRMGKRRALLLFLGLGQVGNIIKWFCYDPQHPWLFVLPSLFIAAGFCALWTLTSSMMADVCDYHEYRTGSRNEATLGAIYSWTMKLGVTAAFAISGIALNLTGFDQVLGGAQPASVILNMRLADLLIPAAAMTAAILLVWRYPLTESASLAIRHRIDRRRASKVTRGPSSAR